MSGEGYKGDGEWQSDHAVSTRDNVTFEEKL